MKNPSIDPKLETACLALLASTFAHDLAQPLQKFVNTVEDFEEIASAGQLTESKTNEFRARIQVLLKDIGELTSNARSLFRQKAEMPLTLFSLKTCLEASLKKAPDLVADSSTIPTDVQVFGSFELTCRALVGVLHYCTSQLRETRAKEVRFRVTKEAEQVSLGILTSLAPLPADQKNTLFKPFQGKPDDPDRLSLGLSRAIIQRGRGVLAVADEAQNLEFLIQLPTQEPQ